MTDITIVSGVVALVVSAVSLFVFYRCRWRDYALPVQCAAAEEDGAAGEAVSIVLSVKNQADDLREVLPLLLAQHYGEFEIIVVDRHSIDETRDVVRALQQSHRNLRYTFIPPTARYVNFEKLAITLGVKAAHFPWVVLTRADARPAGEEWLQALSRCFSPSRDVVMGYANYDLGEGGAGKGAVHARLSRSLRYMRAAVDGKAIGCTTANVAFRRAAFLSCGGFRESVGTPEGEGEFLMQALSDGTNVAVCTSSASFVRLPLPTASECRWQRTWQREIDGKQTARTRFFCVREALTSWCTYAVTLAFLSHAVLRGLAVADGSAYALPWLYFDVPVCLLTLGVCLSAVILFRRATKALGAPRYSLRLFGYALRQPFLTLAAMCRHAVHRGEFRRPIVSEDIYDKRRTEDADG